MPKRKIRRFCRKLSYWQKILRPHTKINYKSKLLDPLHKYKSGSLKNDQSSVIVEVQTLTLEVFDGSSNERLIEEPSFLYISYIIYVCLLSNELFSVQKTVKIGLINKLTKSDIEMILVQPGKLPI